MSSSGTTMSSFTIGDITVQLLNPVHPSDHIGRRYARGHRHSFRSWIGTVGDMDVELWPSNQEDGIRAGLQIGNLPIIWLRSFPYTWQDLLDAIKQVQVAT